ncbi:MAG: aldehyde dehydrogenase family protein, partial [Clostridia bacterium]|nr:aldehyde dehydrogenase family protein [Clostridia bacterium]
MLKDKDLISVQEARDAVNAAFEAFKAMASFSQEKIDGIVKAISDAAEQNSERLAKLAAEETGFGVASDKQIKNLFAAKGVYDAVKDLKTVGILNHDKERKVIDIGTGVGVVAGIVPSTNPTSTVIFKTLISIKAGNSIVFSPHPSANECIIETVKVLSEAATKAGLPEGAIGCIKTPTLNGTKELMQNNKTALILATGGPGLVKSAYTSGKPAIGVGAGNGPAFIDKSADIPLAIKRIFDSKTFDNGTICASEQSIVIEQCIKAEVEAEIKKQGGCILSDCDKERLEKFILRPNGSMNPQIVGKSAMEISKLANLSDVPEGTKVLI